ncbi:MAG TPA: phosphotransferase, partial [Kiritimatiellia bacterium]
ASIITAYEKAMARGHRIAGVVVPDSFWADIGTPAQYIEAHRQALVRFRENKPGQHLVDRGALKRAEQLARRGVKIGGFAAIGNDVTVARGARLRDCVLWDRAEAGARSRIEESIVGSGTRVQGPVNFIALRASDALDEAESRALEKVRWPAEETVAFPLGPRGSARTFTRLQCGAKSAILVRYNPSREENRLYVGHARFLRGIGVPVPAVLFDDPASSVTLFQDLGDRSVQVALRGMAPSDVRALYAKILKKVVILHERGVRKARATQLSLVPAFRPKLYRWEHDLFIEHFLKKRMGLEDAQIAPLRRDLRRVGRKLAQAPSVLVHRDLQSSNILLQDGDPSFIDFQGMRYGPAVYDLASLLCDPYVALPGPLQEELVEQYARSSRNPASIRGLFWHAAVQRLGQALGAYGRLSESAETEYFKQYIPPAMEMLARAVSRVSDLPALARWCGKAARGVGLE